MQGCVTSFLKSNPSSQKGVNLSYQCITVCDSTSQAADWGLLNNLHTTTRLITDFAQLRAASAGLQHQLKIVLLTAVL